MRNFVSLLFFLITLIFTAGAQNLPPLERRTSLAMENETIEKVLTRLGQQTEISFSYNPDAIKSSEKISINIHNETVRLALNEIFEYQMKYRERGKFIIIQPGKNEKNKATIEGYLTSNKGELIKNATIYSEAHNAAVATDEFGYFKLEVKTQDTLQDVKIRKKGYADLKLTPIPGKSSFVQLSMPANEEIVFQKTSTPMYNPLGIVKSKLLTSSENINETIHRVAQISLLPHLGTNNLLAGNTSNMISLNIIGGFTESVEVFEAGAVINIVRKDAGVFQAAGVANYVGGNFRGMQAAGVLNKVNGTFNGVQFSGVGNNIGGNFDGMQAAAVYNLTSGSFWGLQASGVVNIVHKNFTGLQTAGVFSYAKSIKGMQTSGIADLTSQLDGAQISGVLNHTSKGKGLQITGLVNNADSLSGVQISGLVNRAGIIKGAQIGIVNIADSCVGAPIGLFNFIKKGYKHIDVYATETFLANVAYRGGTKHFYTILMFGYAPQSVGSNMLYTYGIGSGTSFRKDKKLNYDLDFIAQNIALGTYTDDINMLYRLGFTANYPIAKKVSLNFGLSYNFYLVDSTTPQYESTFSTLPPYSISNEPVGANRNLKTWIGLKAGIRLL
ncbi:MAG: STN domain-containing protein [Prolixibacteraceae bacterium]|jgi:hypothetical protein|nr:STN domain-containing protein [Prolixibacteraceae bacterium]